MESYLFLFLTASKALKPSHDLNEIAYHTLHLNVLGEYVGSPWGLGQVIVWTPSVSRSQLDAAGDSVALKRIGLYKVQGEAVSATVGAVFQQYVRGTNPASFLLGLTGGQGAAVAHRLFHTRVLPRLLVPGGLSPEFAKEVKAVCEKMGGVDGDLLTGRPSRQPPSAPS